MTQGKNCSRKGQEAWTAFHLHEQPACQESSISRGLRIESDNSEATSAAKSFGLGMAVHGHHTGQPFRKRRILATNSSDAGVKLHVEDGANA